MIRPCPVRVLHWTVCAVLAIQSSALLLGRGSWSVATATLAGVELAAIALFLVPRALFTGAILLAGVLAAAFAIHLTRMGGPPLSFLVYAAAIWVVVQNARRTQQVARR